MVKVGKIYWKIYVKIYGKISLRDESYAILLKFIQKTELISYMDSFYSNRVNGKNP